MSALKEVKPRRNIKGYKIFYPDKKAKLLRSVKHGLTGKPDYILRNGNLMIPLELKSGNLNGAGVPREGDLMQLIAYFVIIKEEFGIKPRQGRLIYRDTMFIVKNKWRFRRRLFKTLHEMRNMLENGVIARKPKPGFMKCKYCICRETVCELNKS